MHPLAILLKFIKNPYNPIENLKTYQVVKHLFAYVFFGITSNVIIFGIIQAVAPSKAVENVSPAITVNNWSEAWVFIIQAVLLAPLVEEFLFRGPISKGSTVFKKISFSFALFLLLFVLQSIQITATKILGYNKLAFLIAAIVIGLAVPLLISNKAYNSPRFTNIYIYLQAIIFALFHINNTNFSSSFAYILAPFLILNQLYLGFVTALVARNYGFMKAVLLHLINNFISVLIVVALSIDGNILIRITLAILAISAYLYGLWAFLDETFIHYKSNKDKGIDIRLS